MNLSTCRLKIDLSRSLIHLVIKPHLDSEHLLKLRAMVSPFCPCILENGCSLPVCHTAVLYCTRISLSLMSEQATGGFCFGVLWVFLFIDTLFFKDTTQVHSDTVAMGLG